MKEATGELNATVVVIMAVGVLMVFFYYTIWPIVRSNFEKNSQCSKAICERCDSNGDGVTDTDCKTVVCYPKGKEHIPENAFECVYKG